MKLITLLFGSCLLLGACSQSVEPKIDTLDPQKFETTVDGKLVELYTLKGGDIVAQFTNFGARLVSLFVADRNGVYQDVVWGYDSIDNYLNAADTYSGPIVGRYGNRIGKGKFTLDGVEYQTTINNNGNHLHGGIDGFSTKIWEGKQLNDSTLVMSYVSLDGEEGYPGEVTIEVKYTTTHNSGLRIEYLATTDAPTVINPTSHCYFNLNGDTSTILDHELLIKGDKFTPTDDGLIPTGEILPVAGTPLDFTTPTKIGKRINADYEPLKFGMGYDHNWIFTTQSSEIAQAELYSPKSGIVMEIYTDQPALQFYSGNFMDGVEVGKRGDKHNYRSGVALEAQNYPDAPNHDNFPSAVLRPEEKYQQSTLYKFSKR